MSRGSSDLSLRTSGRRAGLADDARRLVDDVFGTNSVGRVTTLAEQVDASIVPERLLAILAGFFGAVGALLAAIGLFGLLAYTVARQTKEIGIRMALGATRGRVSRMVATSAGWLVSVGFLLGAPTAFWIHDSPRAASRIFRLAGRCPLPRLRGPDRRGVHRGLRPRAPRHTRRAGHRTTRGIG